MSHLSVLNVGEGDTKLSFDKSNPAERIRAARIVTDMLRRGYALLVEIERGGEKMFQRVERFDETKCEYIIADFDPTAGSFFLLMGIFLVAALGKSETPAAEAEPAAKRTPTPPPRSQASHPPPRRHGLLPSRGAPAGYAGLRNGLREIAAKRGDWSARPSCGTRSGQRESTRRCMCSRMAAR